MVAGSNPASVKNKMAPPPPPPPPPPIMDDIDGLLNGLLDGQSQNEGAVALPNFGAGDINGSMDITPPAPPVKEPQVWEKPLSVPDIRKSSNNWSLASDAGLLLYLQEFSTKMLTKTSDLEKKMDGLIHEAKCTDSRVHNVFNDFLMLANTQFIENRVYDDSEETDQKPDAAISKKEDQTKTREQREAEVIPRVIKALNLGINVLDTAFEELDANVGNSDSEDEDATYKAVLEPILEPKDPYAHRALPYLIGSPAFMQDDSVGVAEITEEEMSEEGSISNFEKTTSESESEYADSETESEIESDTAMQQKKPSLQERSQSESESDLFDQNEKSLENEEDEKLKGGAFTNELTARIGAAPTSRLDDEEAKRDRTISEASAASASSKGKKRKKAAGKDKSGKRRSASKTSGDNLFGEPAPPPEVDEDEESPFGKRGGLFSSSGGGGLFEDDKEDEGDLFDEAPKRRSPSSRRDDHIYEDIGAADQTKATTKSGKNVPAGAVPLFGDSAGEDDLFGSSPTSKAAGDSTRRKQQEASKVEKKASKGGGGLFDDEDDDGLFAAAPAPKPVKKEPAKKTVDLFDDDDDDGDLFGGGSASKPAAAAPPPERKDSTKKKRPAGAVSMFGTVDPLAARKASGEHEDEENESSTPPPVAKREPKAAQKKSDMFDDDKGELFAEKTNSKPAPSSAPTRNSLFADEDGDQDGLFADKESIHVPATSKAPIAKPDANKKSSGGSLFDDIDGDDEGDLFGAASQPKETTKKKPPGGVALFGGADMFGTSPKKDDVEEKPTVKRRDKSPKSRTTLSLFDDNDEKDPLFGDKPKGAKDDLMTRRRTKSKSVFDDEDVLFKIHEEAPPVDLFGSVSPVAAAKPDSNLDKPRSASSASKSLFSDEDDDDLFSAAAKATTKPTSKPSSTKKTEAAAKPKSAPTVDLFSGEGDDGDPLGGVKPPEVKVRSGSKPSPPEVKAKPAAEHGPAEADPLFGVEPSPPATAVKAKKPAGAVSMFAGLDPSVIKRQISSGSTKAEEEGEDKRNRLPSTGSDHTSPKPFMASSSASNKPVSVIRSVKAPQAKKSPGAGNRVSMLQSNLVIDPTAMRPGAAPPSRDTEPQAVSFEDAPKIQTLSSLNKGRIRVSGKRRAPSRRHRTEGAAGGRSNPTLGGESSPLSISADPLFEDRSPLGGLPNIASSPKGVSDVTGTSSKATSASKRKEGAIPDSIDFNAPLDFTSDVTPTSSSLSKPSKKSSDMFGNNDLFTASPKSTISAAPPPEAEDDDNLFASVPQVKAIPPLNIDENLFSSSPKLETSKKKDAGDPFGDDLFGDVPKSKKPGKKVGKTKTDAEAANLFATKSPKKKDTKSSALLMKDDDDLFASVPSTKTKKKKDIKKVEIEDDDDLFATKKPAEKKSTSKKTDSDLFGDSGSNIFDDIPTSKLKDKKKKKEASLFDDQAEDDIFASPTSSKPKKTKTKKKTTEKKPASGGSIFDDSAPSIFDDPLNALGK